MTVSFNVLTEPWIPVVTLDGSRKLLGIVDTLSQAAMCREISSASPLEEFSLYRFLCVFLMDALRPRTETDILNLLRKGAFDMGQISTYIAICESEGVSFDLFDKHRPFMQSAYMEEWDGVPKPIANLDCFVPSGNSHIHFHHATEELYAVPVDKAARLILTDQQFCTAKLQGYPSGVNASPPFFGVVKRPTLFETLVFTLLPVEYIQKRIPFDDPPVIWRSQVPVYPKLRVEKTSWLRGMFFPARRIRLYKPTRAGLIEKINYAQGENYVSFQDWTDPFVTYRMLKDERVPLRPNGEKPVWRSMASIIDIESQLASQLLSQFIRLTGEQYTELTLYGVQTNQASYLKLFRQELRFNNNIVWNPNAVSNLRRCVEAAELLASKIRHSIRSIHSVKEATVTTAVNHFYELAEIRFWKLCEELTTEHTGELLYKQWCSDIGRYAVTTFNNQLHQYALNGRALAHAAEQQSWLEYEVWKLKYPKEETNKDGIDRTVSEKSQIAQQG